jgi:hypothetical protein
MPPKVAGGLAGTADEVARREQVADHVFSETDREPVGPGHLGRDPRRHRERAAAVVVVGYGVEAISGERRLGFVDRPAHLREREHFAGGAGELDLAYGEQPDVGLDPRRVDRLCVTWRSRLRGSGTRPGLRPDCAARVRVQRPVTQ